MFLKPLQPKKEEEIKNEPESKTYNFSIAAHEMLDEYADYFMQKSNTETNEEKIHTDEISSRLAVLYEKIRKVVDWKDEHLMRRMAIERTLKRRVFLSLNNKDKTIIAESLIKDLIRGGHFKNDSIAKSKIIQIEHILARYDYIWKNCPVLGKGMTKAQFQNRLFRIAACEVEETLDPSIYRRIDILIDFMYGLMVERIVVREGKNQENQISEENKNIQIYIAVQKALFKLDTATICYNLMKKYNPKWFNANEEIIKYNTQNVHYFFKEINNQLHHPMLGKFYAVCERYDTPFLLFSDVINQNPPSVWRKFSNSAALALAITNAYNQRLSTLGRRLFRSAVLSVISVFLGKVLILAALEIPINDGLNYLFYGAHLAKMSLVPIAFDVGVPVFLMVLFALSIHKPKKENLDIVLKETEKIVYEQDKKDLYEVISYRKKNPILMGALSLLYFIGFCITTSAVCYFLHRLHLPVFSYFVFFVFASLVLYIGTQVRKKSRELHLDEEKEGVASFLFDMFTLPFVYFGRWLSSKWQKYNIFSVFMNVVIETPLIAFVEFFEQWRYYLKEKKEDIN